MNTILEHLKQIIMAGVALLQTQWLFTISIIVLLLLLEVFWLRRKKRGMQQSFLVLVIIVDSAAVCCLVLELFEGFSRSDIISTITLIFTALAVIMPFIQRPTRNPMSSVTLEEVSTLPRKDFIRYIRGGRKGNLPTSGGFIRYIRGDKKAPSLALELKYELKYYSFEDRKSRPRSLDQLIKEMGKDLREARSVILVLSGRCLEKLGQRSEIGDAFSQLAPIDDCRVTLVIVGSCNQSITDDIERFKPIWVEGKKKDDVLFQLKKRIECARKKSEQARRGQY